MSFYLTRRESRIIRDLARLSSALACLIFIYLSVSKGPPETFEGPGIERDIQYIFVVVGVVATLLAWWRPVWGGGLLVVTGGALGVAAAGRYSTETALFVALLFVVPGVLFLLLWAQRRPLLIQLATAAFVIVLMVLGGIRAQQRHDYAFGPAHPQSDRVAIPVDRVEWMWSGNVSSEGASVNAKLVAGSQSARLVISPNEDLSDPFYSDDVTVPADTGRVVSLRTDGLEPGTPYHYGIEVDGVLDANRRGSFTSFPVGPASFTVAVSACARTGSNGLVFERIASYQPLAYIINGDFHYENIDTADMTGFRRAYDKQLMASAQAYLYSQTPIAYAWDDHDFGGNNSNASSAAKETAWRAYRQMVPHYDLPGGADQGPIYQAFDIGRVRFVITDTRSERDAETRDGQKRIMSQQQMDWLKQELLDASRNQALVVWATGVPWIGADGSSPDDWAGYTADRREIADFIAGNGITNLLLLGGDAHMLGIDDGTNSDYSSGGAFGFPVMQAGALDRPGSVKGGPMSEGMFPGAGQFGLVSVEDDGQTVNVKLTGLNWLGEEIVSYAFTVNQPPG